MPSRSSDDPEAKGIAVAALSYIATDPKTLNRFFELTGLAPSSVREAVGSPAFSAVILDFVLSSDELARAVARAQDLTPEAIAEARQRIMARDIPNDDWPPRSSSEWA